MSFYDDQHNGQSVNVHDQYQPSVEDYQKLQERVHRVEQEMAELRCTSAHDAIDIFDPLVDTIEYPEIRELIEHARQEKLAGHSTH
jgi:hypothetical protein